MRLVAFDLSLRATGYAVADTEDDGGLVTRSGVINPPCMGVERLAFYQSRLWELAEGADLVVIEEYAFSAHAAHAHELGELGGVVRLTLHKRGVRWLPMPIKTMKRYATGNGNARKEVVLTAAVRRLDYFDGSYDEADALWLLFMALDQYQLSPITMPAAQRQALTVVAWPDLTES